MISFIMAVVLQGGFFFGEYYGTPSGCEWACTEGECVTLPRCNSDPKQGPLGDGPLIRLESQTGDWFSAPRIGFDYIVSGPFHHVITQYKIDWQVQVFLGLAPNDLVVSVDVTGTVPVTMWVRPDSMPLMNRLYGNYTYTLHVPDNPALIGLTVYHQTVMWWTSPSGKWRIAASRGVKATIEDR